MLLLLIHMGIHFPHPLSYFPGGLIHRDDQVKDKLVQYIDQYGK